jgi:hypothetical protein
MVSGASARPVSAAARRASSSDRTESYAAVLQTADTVTGVVSGSAQTCTAAGSGVTGASI